MYPNSNYQQNVVNGGLPPPQPQQAFQQQPQQHQSMNPTGINKYMPPPPQQQPQGSFSPISPATNANFPPHMRPQNLQNGTSGSNASSRTASPLPPMQQQHQVNRPPMNGNQLIGNMQNMSLVPPQGSPRPVQPYPSVQNGLPQSAPLPPAAHPQPQNSPLPHQNFQAGLGLHGMNKNTPSMPGMPHMPPQNTAYTPNKPPQQPPPLNHQNVLNNNAYQQQPTQPLRSMVPGPIPPYQPQSQAPQQLQQQQQMPPQRNPMYPNVVQQPPPPAFNGIPNPAPMQYQTQQQQQFGQPQQQQQYGQQQQTGQMGVTQQGFNRLWGQETVDLMQSRHILSPASLVTPKINLNHAFHESVNCNPE